MSKIWSRGSNPLAPWCKELTHWKRPWCWERLKAEEEDGKGWDGWMASLTQGTWVWANSGRWWRTGKPGVLQSMDSWIVEHNWANEQLNNKKSSIRAQTRRDRPDVLYEEPGLQRLYERFSYYWTWPADPKVYQVLQNPCFSNLVKWE